MRWGKGIYCTYAYNILIRKPEGREHLRDLDIDGRILRWILKE
jgi:hypothetical protein